jgi:hypothetical protein
LAWETKSRKEEEGEKWEWRATVLMRRPVRFSKSGWFLPETGVPRRMSSC